MTKVKKLKEIKPIESFYIGRKDVIELLDAYFQNLIFVPDPQATKEEIIKKIKNL